MDYSFGKSSYETDCTESYQRVTGIVNVLTNSTHSLKDFEILKSPSRTRFGNSHLCSFTSSHVVSLQGSEHWQANSLEGLYKADTYQL